jgi:hypothetical protein
MQIYAEVSGHCAASAKIVSDLRRSLSYLTSHQRCAWIIAVCEWSAARPFDNIPPEAPHGMQDLFLHEMCKH